MSPKPLEGDLDEIVYTMFYSKSAGNYGRIKDPKLDDLVLAQQARHGEASLRTESATGPRFFRRVLLMDVPDDVAAQGF